MLRRWIIKWLIGNDLELEEDFLCAMKGWKDALKLCEEMQETNKKLVILADKLSKRQEESRKVFQEEQT